ncbi:MAG: hypothetical protein E6H09_10645 [Bacteroidetes bacterium]|jgi:hypothetical protein|nr:MAG: hypothetical protein E6H09_10645 [Bacteroidota bacterium]
MQTDQHLDAFIQKRNEHIRMFSLIAAFNRQAISKADLDKLDRWIATDDFDTRLFEFLLMKLCPGAGVD